MGTHWGVPKATKLAWLCLRVRLEVGGLSPFCCFLWGAAVWGHDAGGR